MYLLILEKVSECKARVIGVVYEFNENEIPSNSIIVPYILEEPEEKKGIRYVHYINPNTGEQWYEEKKRPLNQEEIQQEINEKIDLLLQMQLSMQGVI
ncbi:MAG: hypothetical protein GXW85_04990 [Clostridia bacterium]|nr:hypothetical protein [Clostridia bacterium]